MQEEPVFKTGLKSVQFVGVDSNAPEESPGRNRSAGAGPLPPREEKAIESSPRPSLGDEAAFVDVHIEVEEDKRERKRESKPRRLGAAGGKWGGAEDQRRGGFGGPRGASL